MEHAAAEHSRRVCTCDLAHGGLYIILFNPIVYFQPTNPVAAKLLATGPVVAAI